MDDSAKKASPAGKTGDRAHESEAKYRRLYDLAPDMIFLRDPQDGRLIDINVAACRLLGYARGELLWKSYFDLLDGPDEIASCKRLFRDALASGAGTRIAVFRCKDGSRLEAEVRNTPIEIAGRTWMLGIARDLTAQRQLEREALAFYQAFQNSNDYMFFTDRNGVIQEVNDAFVRRFGYAREEAVGRTPRIVRSARTGEETYTPMWASILDPAKGFWRGRIVNRTKAGEEVPLLLSITSVRDARGQIVGFVSSAVDLGELETLQARLARSESLAAVGSMAAVLAHEIRNPLGSIVTAAQSILRAELAPADREALLKVIRKESARLNESLSQFLEYARPREPKKTDTDLNAAVGEVLRIVRSDDNLRGGVSIEERLDASLRAAPFDGNQVRQVLWNVIRNALEAMDGSGLLRVATEARPGHAAVSVSDTGPGIPRDQLQLIFRPFHSTKQRGTGLGLSVAERVAHAHDGRLVVDSELGKGTRVTLLLPLAQEAP